MASDREDIIAARKALGAQLRAWRERAGLTQQHLARRTGYSRTSIAAAEAGEPRSAALFQAADPVTGAEGALVTAYAEATAIIAAIRSRAARAARELPAGLAMAGLTVGGDATGAGWRDDAAVAVQDHLCPACHTPLTVTCYTLVALTARPAGP